jgi:uncharacterized protein
MNSRIASLWLAALCCIFFGSNAAETMPPKPARYFNDYAMAVPRDTADRLNTLLEDFEKKTSSQIVVAIFPKMNSDSSVEDYTVRVAQSWRVGQKGTNNGAVLFVFLQDRQVYLQVGYGLEGAIPDATAKQIIEQDIKPPFRNGDYAGGLTAGVNSILKAAVGEYKGTGRTVNQRVRTTSRGIPWGFFIILFLAVMIAKRQRAGVLYSGGRRRYSGGWSTGGWGGGGGGWSGGGGGGGGGGFSSGGGSFGGGGAGGKW